MADETQASQCPPLHGKGKANGALAVVCRVAISGVLTMLACAGHAQSVIGVRIDHTGEDVIGQRLSWTITERIRQSASFIYLETYVGEPHIRWITVSVDGRVGSPGTSTAMSYAIVIDGGDFPGEGQYLTSGVQTCGTQRVAECAEGMIASLWSALQAMRTSSSDHSRALYARLTGNRPQVRSAPRSAPTQRY